MVVESFCFLIISCGKLNERCDIPRSTSQVIEEQVVSLIYISAWFFILDFGGSL
jgi:hypothetical protein